MNYDLETELDSFRIRHIAHSGMNGSGWGQLVPIHFPSSSNVQISASCKLPFSSVVIERKRRFFHRFFIASSTDEKRSSGRKKRSESNQKYLGKRERKGQSTEDIYLMLMRTTKGIIWEQTTLSQRLKYPLKSFPEFLHSPHHIHLRYPNKPLCHNGLWGFLMEEKGKKNRLASTGSECQNRCDHAWGKRCFRSLQGSGLRGTGRDERSGEMMGIIPRNRRI